MDEKTKVLYLSPSVKLLGARRSLLALIKGLSSKFKPIVVCPKEGPLTEELHKLDVETHCIPLYQWRKGRYFFHRLFSLWRLRRLIEEIKPHLLHCNEFYVMPYALKAAWEFNIPIICHIRLNITQRQIKNYFINRSARIIVVSEALARIFKNTTLQERVEVIYNAVDPDEFSGDAKANNIRQELGISNSVVLIGQVGSIEPRKRQHIVLRAARKVIEEFPQVYFVFVGNPRRGQRKYFQQLLTLTENLGLGERVSFLPFRRQIASVYSGLDINLLPSAEEGFGRTIVESGFFAVPSIGTRVGGIPELIENERTGYLIELDEVEQMSEAILKLSKDEEKRRQFGNAAKELVKEKFLLPPHCRKIEELYLQLMQDKTQLGEEK